MYVNRLPARVTLEDKVEYKPFQHCCKMPYSGPRIDALL